MSKVSSPGSVATGPGASVREIAARFGNDPARLMDIGRAVHAALGHISEETVGEIAGALGVRRAAVRDALSFYVFFPRIPQGKTVIHVCNAVSELMLGAAGVVAAFEQALGIRVGETTPCGAFTLHHAPCIGMSDQGPSALINGVPVVGLKPADVPALLDALRAGTPPSALPQPGSSGAIVNSLRRFSRESSNCMAASTISGP